MRWLITSTPSRELLIPEGGTRASTCLCTSTPSRELLDAINEALGKLGISDNFYSL